ncbi:hypothetical protein ABFX02_03G039100 [Erythranthe guttata]
MQIINPFGVGILLKKMVLLIIMVALLVSAGDEKNQTSSSMVLFGSRKISALLKLQESHQEKQKQKQKQKHVFDEFFTSKRRVPNESDPLHNR